MGGTTKAVAKDTGKQELRLSEITADIRRMTEAAGKIENFAERTAALEAANAKLAADMTTVQEQIRRQNISLPGAEDIKRGTGKGQFDFGKLLMCLRFPNSQEVQKLAAFELDVMKQTAKRNEEELQRRNALFGEPAISTRGMNTLTGADGGFALAEELMPEVFPAFYAQTVIAEAGARFISPSGWPFRINRVATKSTAYNHAEGVAPTASTPQLAQITMRPRKTSTMVIMTDEQLKYGTPSTDSWVQDDMAMVTNIEVDRGCLVGDDTDNEPLGLFLQGNSSDLTVNGDLTLYQLKRFKAKLMSNNALVNGGKFAYIFHPDAVSLLEQERIAQYSGDTGGVYVFDGVANAAIEAKVGYKVLHTTSIPTTVGSGSQSYGVFGNFNDFLVARWGGIQIKRSYEATAGSTNLFETDSMAIKISTLYDCAIVRGSSFATSDDVDVS